MTEIEQLNPFEDLSPAEARELAESLQTLAQLERARILTEKQDNARREEGLQKMTEAAQWDNYLNPGFSRQQVEAATAELEALQSVDLTRQTPAQRRRRGEIRDWLNKATKSRSDQLRAGRQAWQQNESGERRR